MIFSLRAVTAADISLILKWRNQPEIREKMHSTHIISEAEHRAYFERIKDDATKLYFTCRDDQGQPVSVIDFVDNLKHSTALDTGGVGALEWLSTGFPFIFVSVGEPAGHLRGAGAKGIGRLPGHCRDHDGR